MASTVTGIHLGIDIHANRPAANTCPDSSLYSCSTHKLIYKSNYAGNSWSTWATLPADSGSLATDTLWGAAGDIVVATGNDAAARLPIGAAGGVLGISGGAVAWVAGTSFPGSPTSGDTYFRTDLGLWFKWDGTYWLSLQQFTIDIPVVGAAAWPLAATTGGTHRAVAPMLLGANDAYITTLATAFLVSGGTALSGSHKWVGQLFKTHGGTATAIATINIDSGASSTWRTDAQAINALMNGGTVEMEVDMTWTKTGTPGSLYVVHRLQYRIRAT